MRPVVCRILKRGWLFEAHMRARRYPRNVLVKDECLAWVWEVTVI